MNKSNTSAVVSFEGETTPGAPSRCSEQLQPLTAKSGFPSSRHCRRTAEKAPSAPTTSRASHSESPSAPPSAPPCWNRTTTLSPRSSYLHWHHWHWCYKIFSRQDSACANRGAESTDLFLLLVRYQVLYLATFTGCTILRASLLHPTYSASRHSSRTY